MANPATETVCGRFARSMSLGERVAAGLFVRLVTEHCNMKLELCRRGFLASIPALAALVSQHRELLNACDCYTADGVHFARILRYADGVEGAVIDQKSGEPIPMTATSSGNMWFLEAVDERCCGDMIVSWDDPKKSPQVKLSIMLQNPLPGQLMKA